MIIIIVNNIIINIIIIISSSQSLSLASQSLSSSSHQHDIFIYLNREFMSSFGIYEHKPHHCAMTKLIPASRLSTFTIQHYYQQRHVAWTSVFLGDL